MMNMLNTMKKLILILPVALLLQACSEQVSLSTAAAGTDETPNAFAFASQDEVELNTTVESDAVFIDGLSVAVAISITAGEYSIDGGDYTAADGVVGNGSQVRIRQTSSSEYDSEVVSTIQIGTESASFASLTKSEPAAEADDAEPDAFSFTRAMDVELASNIVSESVTISGINVAVPVSVSGGAYSIDGGEFTEAAGSISRDQSLRLSHTSSDALATTQITTVTVGGYSTSFRSTTGAIDTTPDAFAFAAQDSVDINSAVESESITISGLNSAADLSISAGEYSLDGGATYSSDASTLAPDSTIQLRHTSSSEYETSMITTLTIGGVEGYFESTTASAPDDTTPDAFSFPSKSDVNTEVVVVSDTVTISGLEVAAPVSVSLGEYSIDGGAFTASVGSINNGQRLQLRHISSSERGGTVTSTVAVGDYRADFSSTTMAESIDTTPDAFSFATQYSVDRSDYVYSEAVTITGLGAPASLSVSNNGEYSIDGGQSYSSAEGSISTGTSVQLRHVSSAEYGTSTVTTLTIGGVEGYFESITEAAPGDSEPDAFTFTELRNAPLGTSSESDVVYISGISVPATVTVAGGEYRIDGGAYTAADGSIDNGQSLQLRHTNSSDYAMTTTSTVTVGGVSAEFSSTTEAEPLDTEPDDFSFASIDDAALGAGIESEAITVSGIGTSVGISVVNGKYKVNDGDYTDAAGSVVAGDVVGVRHISSTANATSTSTELTISNLTRTFTSTTAATANDASPNALSFAKQTGVPANTLIESELQSLSGIDLPVAISIDYGEYRIDGGDYTAQSGTIGNNQSVQIRHTSSPTSEDTTTSVLSVGDISANFTTITEAAAGDTKITPIDLGAKVDVALNTIYESNQVTIEGIGADVSVSVTIAGGEYRTDFSSDGDEVWTSADGSLSLGDAIQVRHTSSADYSTTVSTSLSIGGDSFVFATTTTDEPSDSTPEAFSFAGRSDVALNSEVTSDPILVQGINVPTSISVSSSYDINESGNFTSLAGEVTEGDRVRVRHTSASDYSTTTTTTLIIGGVSGEFKSTTVARDDVPDAFSFTAQAEVELGASIISDAITVSGINAPSSVSVSSGSEYQIGNELYTSVDGTVNVGDEVRVRHTSSSNYATTVTSVLTIGGVAAEFNSTTELGDSVSGSVIDGPLENARVFLDIDDDGEWDADEPYTFTDENGSYQLQAPEGYFEQYRLVAEITTDTIDTETGEVAHPYSLVFYDPNTQSAFEGFLSTDFVLNPFTTMVQSEVEAGNAPLDAVELVATHLGLNPQHHFYLLADYMEVKATGEYLDEQLSGEDMDVINRLHNIARTAVRVLGIKMTEINAADPTLSARGKALASQQVLNALKIKLRDVIDTSDEVASAGDGSDAEQELDLNAELYAANIDATAILANVNSILDDADSLKPGRPVVIAPDYPLDSSALADIALTWNMYYGENGDSVYLQDVANASVVGSAVALSADSPNAQGGEFSLDDSHFSAEAVYQLQVCLENASGISCSTSFSVTVMDSEVFTSGVDLTLPLAASGDPDKRPQAPQWDGWMQNVADGYVRTGDYYAPSWNKWSGALAETYEFYRCDEILGIGTTFENSRCEKLNSDDTAPEALSTWDRWLGGEVVGQAGGQTAKEIIAAAVCHNRYITASSPCYFLDDGSDKGMQHLHQVRLCNNNYADCSVSPILKLKVVEADGTYDVVRYDDDSGTAADQDQTSEVNTTDPTVPPNKDADPTIGDNGGGSVTDPDEMVQGMDITAPSVQYVEGSWQPFLPSADVTIGMVKYWGQAGDLWELWAEGPLAVVDGAVERDASLAQQIASGSVSPMPAVSETWSDSATVSFAEEGMYVIFGAFCNSGNNLAANPEACAKSSNTQTIEVSSSQSRTVVSTPAPDTGGDDDGGSGDSGNGSGDSGDATGFALLESEEYSRLESERRGDKLNEAITNIRTVGVDQHEVVDGEDDGPDLNTYSFANVERVQAIFVERYSVLESKGLLYETASDEANQARIAWEWLFPMANGHIKQFPSAYNADVAAGKYPYTYTNYLKAVAKYPAFCGDDAADSSADLDELCMQAMASMFAHFAQEVGGHLGNTNATYTAPVNGTLIDRSGDKETGNNDDGGPMKEFACSGTESGGWCGDQAQSIPEWRQALYWVNESGCSETGAGCLYRSCDPGTWQAEAWPCPADTKYFGRGPKQLSYNYNYGPYSYIIYGDVNPLLQNPAKVTEGWLAFASAVYFFMQPRPPKPSMFELIYGYWSAPTVNSATDVDSKEPGPSFGASIMIINGGIECGGSKATAQAANRVKYYTGFMDYFGLDPEMGISYDKTGVQTHKTASMSCMNMLAFEPSHGAAYPSYWEEDWSALGQCQLVTYETAFSGYLDGDYEKCVHNLLK